jgi:predicted signal transduction protein with EAL and GGDEF domain
VSWYRGDDASINRLGGDEFTLVFPGVKHLRALTILAQRVNDLFADPFSVVDNDLHVTCSVGISVFPNDGTDGETLVKHADIAMYRAKESGKNSFAFYNPSMSEQLKNATEIEGRLRKAIGAGKVEVYYQPKVDAGSNCVVGCEALARWHDPVLGQIPPSRFIPVAEEAGLIRELDLSILERACEDLGRLHAGGLMLSVSVNFSNHHFEQDDIVERTLEILERTGYPKHLLEIEITESAMIGDVDCAIAKLEQLRKHGIGVALDDFGTGFSSLTYLSRLPIDVLKIDRAFITRLDCHNESAVLEGIMMIAHRLGRTVVAEGVETAAQLERLRCFGEPVIQGYLFSRPLAPADFAAYLEDFERGGGRVVRKAGRWPMLAHAAT